MLDNKSNVSDATYLPNIQLFYLFYVSLAFVFPMAYTQNIVGLLICLGLIAFYILAEFKGLIKARSTNEKKLFVDCIIMFLVGVTCTLFGLIFVGVGVFMLFRVYMYVAPKKVK